MNQERFNKLRQLMNSNQTIKLDKYEIKTVLYEIYDEFILNEIAFDLGCKDETFKNLKDLHDMKNYVCKFIFKTRVNPNKSCYFYFEVEKLLNCEYHESLFKRLSWFDSTPCLSGWSLNVDPFYDDEEDECLP